MLKYYYIYLKYRKILRQIIHIFKVCFLFGLNHVIRK